MNRGSVFRSNRGQAVRLPKSAAFPDSVRKVDVIVLGNARLLAPAGEAWTAWFDSPGVSDDCMAERGQPADQERASLWLAMRQRSGIRDSFPVYCLVKSTLLMSFSELA